MPAPIPTNDVWIAACALCADERLLARVIKGYGGPEAIN
jgi:hypothetical protein